ncbi:MAG: glucose-6-phosphate dehydrogenase [Aerococcaceae bacterium]|nr:glucose-6-phosphate dehydrogenase [Aerococcaceae bacterium]
MQERRLLITLFGATGDLAARKLYPAIYRLYLNGHLSEHFALIGTARREWSHDYFREVVHNSIQALAPSAEHAEQFASHFYYQPHDVTDEEHYIKLKTLADELDAQYDLAGNRLFYLSTSPSFFPIIAEHLKSEQLLSETGFNRLIIEKPFGHDLQTATELQATLTRTFDESQIYRIDHYLGKEIVQAIHHVRFHNRLFAQNWNANHIDHVQITLAETVGVEERGEYYETSGVTRDMIQNHTLQLLALIAMHPTEFTAEAIQQAKIDVLNHIHLDETTESIVRAQYAQTDTQLGYLQEDKVNPNSTTETYFAANVQLDLPEWQNVPFYIRSGKRLSDKSTVIDVQFKGVDAQTTGERLRFEIAPNLRYEYWLNAKTLGYSQDTERIALTHTYSADDLSNSPDDYERLIGECIDGDKQHFAHWEEVAASWRYIDHVQSLWQKETTPKLATYPAGSHGPQEADELLARNGHQWECL